MPGIFLNPLTDPLLVAIPLIAILALRLLRLDTIFGASRPFRKRRRPRR
jgi:hypothetical protein